MVTIFTDGIESGLGYGADAANDMAKKIFGDMFTRTSHNVGTRVRGISATQLVAWEAGHLDLVTLFQDGTIRNKSWDESLGAWWPGQDEWATIGGECETPPLICSWGPGHVDVVARFKDGTIRNKSWDTTTGKWWPDQLEWANLGGDGEGPPAVCAWGPDHLDVFARFSDGSIRNKAWDASTAEWWPGQTEWASLGGDCAAAPAVCAWSPGHLDLVARFKDGTLRNKVWDAATGKWWPGQTEWANLGGSGQGSPALCAWGPGHLDLVARFEDGTIRNKSWDSSTGKWWPGQTEWASLGGDAGGDPAICAWDVGHIDLVVRFRDGTIRNKSWDASTGKWWPGQAEWANLGGDCSGDPAIHAWGPGHLDVVARFSDGTIKNKVWDKSRHSWWPGQLDWASLGSTRP